MDLKELKKYYGYIIENNPNSKIYWQNNSRYHSNKMRACVEFLKEKNISFKLNRIWSNDKFKSRFTVLTITNKIYSDFWDEDNSVKFRDRPTLEQYHNLFEIN